MMWSLASAIAVRRSAISALVATASPVLRDCGNNGAGQVGIGSSLDEAVDFGGCVERIGHENLLTEFYQRGCDNPFYPNPRTTGERSSGSRRAATKADLAALKEALTWRVFLIVGGLLAIDTAVNRVLGQVPAAARKRGALAASVDKSDAGSE